MDSSNERVRSTIQKRQEQRHRAMAEGDIAVLDALLDEALVYSHSDASRDTKVSYLDKVRSGAMRYSEVRSTEEEVMLLADDTACVVGRMTVAGDLAGVHKRLDNRFLAVWVRRGRDWKLVAFQPTPASG